MLPLTAKTANREESPIEVSHGELERSIWTKAFKKYKEIYFGHEKCHLGHCNYYNIAFIEALFYSS